MRNDIIGNRLRAYREQYGYTQRYVAQRINVDASTISNYERGSRNVPMEQLQHLAELYGTTIDELIKEPSREYHSQSRVHLIKRPYRAGWSPISTALALIWVALILAHGVEGPGRFTLPATVATLAFFVYHAYRFFIHRPAQRRGFTLPAGERVVYRHSEDSSGVNRLRFFEYYALLALFVTFIIMNGMVINSIESEGEQMFFAMLVVFVSLFYLSLALISILSPRRTRIYDEEVNLSLNTYRYLIIKGLAACSYIIYITYYTPVAKTIPQPILYLLLVHGHLLLSWVYADVKLKEYEQFKLTNEITSQS